MFQIGSNSFKVMQKNDTENKELTREEIKEQLQWGDLTLIAKVADVGISTVKRWFNNENDNPAVKRTVEKLQELREKKITDRLKELL